MTDDEEPLSLAAVNPPENVRINMLRLEPGDAIDYQMADWARALVVVEQGVLEIECAGGGHARFAAGAVLTFAGLGIRRMSNAGEDSLILRAVSHDFGN